jgi:diguanylate cyclase (GGDEF)-like protein|tara:strand:- start:354 stop:581 length:228 start_codon:yes stop_codon:yes gene_type:complete
LEVAIQLAARVRAAVEEHVFNYDSIELKITISIGVTLWSGEEELDSPESLVEITDKHLYAAKEAGRNSVKHDLIP